MCNVLKLVSAWFFPQRSKAFTNRLCSMLQGKQRGILLRLHLYIQAASLALAALGFIFIYSSRSIASKQHFTTLHTWVGLSALIGFLMVAAGGVLLYYGLPKRYKKFTGQISRIHKLVSRLPPFPDICDIRTNRSNGINDLGDNWGELVMSSVRAWLLFARNQSPLVSNPAQWSIGLRTASGQEHR